MPKKSHIPQKRASPVTLAVFGFFSWLVTNGAGVILTVAVFLAIPLLQKLQPKVNDEKVKTEAATLDAPEELVIEEETPPEPEQEPEPDVQEEPEQQNLDINSIAIGFDGDSGGGALMPSLADQLSGNSSNFLAKGEDSQPTPVSQDPPPKYPTTMAKKGIGGRVVIRAAINTRGQVTNPTVVEATRPEFKTPALTAVRKWRFNPGKRNGVPVTMMVNIPVKFGT